MKNKNTPLLHTKDNDNVEAGFTLIELSIVLVIIGLIIGGILVGQDLIKASEIRATAGQIEKYNSAVNTFRSKFNGLPGDITQASAASFGLLAYTGIGPTGAGDGNGLIEGFAANSTTARGETVMFWRHLSDANLIDGSLGVQGNSLPVVGTALLTGDLGGATGSVGTLLPATKTTPSNYFTVYAYQGLNYYQILPVTAITAATGAYTMGNTGLTPLQAYNIDIKLDDGLPNTGAVVAMATGTVGGSPTPSFTAAANNGSCLMGTGVFASAPVNTYNRDKSLGGNDNSCSLRFRFN